MASRTCDSSQDARLLAELNGHTGPVKSVAWLPQVAGKALAESCEPTASKDHTLRTWRGRDGSSTCEAAPVGHTSRLRHSLLTRPGTASAPARGSMLLWSVGDLQPPAAAAEEALPARKVGRRTRCPRPRLPRRWSRPPRYRGTKAVPPLLADGRAVYSAGWHDPRVAGRCRDHECDTAGQAAVLSLDVSLASTLTASGHTDHVLRVWDSRLQQAALQLRLNHQGWVADVAVPARPNLLASASYDGSVRLWMRSTAPLHTLCEHDGKALCLAWTVRRSQAAARTHSFDTQSWRSLRRE